MSALLPVGSTIRKLALDVLRSGKAFEPDGVKHFKKLYKTFEGKSAPDEVVSEFRRIVDVLKAREVAGNVAATRMRRAGNERLAQEVQGPRADVFPRALSYFESSGKHGVGFDDLQRPWVLTAARADTQGDVAKEMLRQTPEGKSRTLHDSASILRNRLAHSRQQATEARTHLALMDSLKKLFGESL